MNTSTTLANVTKLDRDAERRNEMARYKKELAQWQKQNRANIELFRKRVESYNRLLRLNKTERQLIQNRYNESVRQINAIYEEHMAKTICPKARRELDIERRTHLGDAILIRDMALQEISNLPEFPEFLPTEGRPVSPHAHSSEVITNEDGSDQDYCNDEKVVSFSISA